MGRFDLTRTQEKWTIGGLAAAVATIVAVIAVPRPASRETGPQGGTMSLASQIEPGTYALTGASWLAAGHPVLTGRPPETPVRDGETAEQATNETNEGPVLAELEGMPISVGGR